MANLIYDSGSIASSVTQVDIDLTSTPIEKGELYELECTIINPDASGTSLRLYANNNLTDSNYYGQFLLASGSVAPSGARTSYPYVSGIDASQTTIFHSYVKLSNDGKLTYISNTTRSVSNGANINLINAVGSSTVSFSSITTLSVKTGGGNRIGVNSRIQLRKVAEKVQDIEVGTSVTQVDITETIEKGNEYLLVSDIVTGTTDSAVGLFVNDDTTPSNYYNQDIVVISNTYLQGQRVNSARFSTANTGTKSLCVAKIKVANSGIFNCQSQVINKYGGSNVLLEKYALSKTATITNITKLNVKSDVANAIGIGSRFELYKLI